MSHDAHSLGPVQVTDNAVISINDALRQVQERINALYGLSGPLVIHNTGTADAFRVVDEDDQVIHAMGTTT